VRFTGLLALVSLSACGGRVIASTENTMDGAGGPDVTFEPDTGLTDDAGSATAPPVEPADAAESVDAVADAGTTSCVTQPNACVLCNGQYYCPGLPAAPPCADAAGIQEGQPCTTSCIVCPSVLPPPFPNVAWSWSCDATGTYGVIHSTQSLCP
jgi:hypothetical protein